MRAIPIADGTITASIGVRPNGNGPVLAAVFIARVATVVEPTGLRVRALFGSRMLAWERIRGLSVGGRNVYAVTADGTGNTSYDGANHERMTELRAEKVARLADELPPLHVDSEPGANLLVLGWGSTEGAIRAGAQTAG